MNEGEIESLIDLVSRNPSAGEIMVGTGGCRKLRVAGRGKGKSGGYRTITFYANDSVPVFLLTVFGKGERANLSQAERKALHETAKTILAEFQRPRPTRKQGK